MKQKRNLRRSRAGRAFEEVMLACVGTSFRIRAAGQRTVPQAMASWGGGIGEPECCGRSNLGGRKPFPSWRVRAQSRASIFSAWPMSVLKPG